MSHKQKNIVVFNQGLRDTNNGTIYKGFCKASLGLNPLDSGRKKFDKPKSNRYSVIPNPPSKKR